MTDTIEEVSDAGFETDVLQSDEAVVVTFWANWCGPCRAVAPMLEELVDEHGGDVRLVRIDVDDNPQTPSYYGIKSIPTFLRFHDGEVVDRVVGAVPKTQIAELFEP